MIGSRTRENLQILQERPVIHLQSHSAFHRETLAQHLELATGHRIVETAHGYRTQELVAI